MWHGHTIRRVLICLLKKLMPPPICFIWKIPLLSRVVGTYFLNRREDLGSDIFLARTKNNLKNCFPKQIFPVSQMEMHTRGQNIMFMVLRAESRALSHRQTPCPVLTVSRTLPAILFQANVLTSRSREVLGSSNDTHTKNDKKEAFEHLLRSKMMTNVYIFTVSLHNERGENYYYSCSADKQGLGKVMPSPATRGEMISEPRASQIQTLRSHLLWGPRPCFFSDAPSPSESWKFLAQGRPSTTLWRMNGHHLWSTRSPVWGAWRPVATIVGGVITTPIARGPFLLHCVPNETWEFLEHRTLSYCL